jgi:DNA gyrase/topoisomerase IV subunit B
VTGGRNGYGAKLANIFSRSFIIETADSASGKKYTQRFFDNMSRREDPVIEPYAGKDYTVVTFQPDLARFSMESLDEDIVGLLSKRVYDMAGVLGKVGATRGEPEHGPVGHSTPPPPPTPTPPPPTIVARTHRVPGGGRTGQLTFFF